MTCAYSFNSDAVTPSFCSNALRLTSAKHTSESALPSRDDGHALCVFECQPSFDWHAAQKQFGRSFHAASDRTDRHHSGVLPVACVSHRTALLVGTAYFVDARHRLRHLLSDRSISRFTRAARRQARRTPSGLCVHAACGTATQVE